MAPSLSGAMPAVRRGHDALARLASDLFAAAGLPRDKAGTVASLLVLTDLMGRHTHGLTQCGTYLDQVVGGGMTAEGGPEVVRDTGATLVWDGNYLPGLWLMDEAMRTCLDRVPQHGVVTFAMRRSHHIGCLAALARQATERGCYAMLASSGPHTRYVAPYGGKQGLFSPNPFAFAIPTSAAPVLVDICASLTTVSMTRQTAVAGEQFDHPWLLDHDGAPTRDPSVLEGDGPRGSLMLLGGEDAGHKGFGLALMVEALTQGLSGHGRRDAPTRWGASVYCQVIDPAAFAGRAAFLDQVDFFTGQCRANPPVDPAHPVRLPGDQADRNIARGRTEGVPLAADTVVSLTTWASRLGVDASMLV